MLRAAIFSLTTALLVPALALQVPLVSNHRWKDEDAAIIGDGDDMGWSINIFPNPNATDHLVFETVHSLLQHWPNTRMRNGHNIVPGIVPKGTLLYHGADRKEIPLGPEWVAIDPEHSYFFCRKHFRADFHPKECWQLTVATTRPLKVIYFDGNSAAKLPYGSLDTQDLLAWGDSPFDNVWDEEQRAEELCGWGKAFSVDGFVRMEMDFEVILCDFTSGVNVVSFAGILRTNDLSPSSLAMFESMNAGSWHNRFPGETRIQLDLAGLISFYDTELVPSLVAVRTGQERWDHRVLNISSEDFSVVKSRLEAALTRPSALSSGIDWKTLVHVIVDRFAGRLELIRYLLKSSATHSDEIIDLANKTQTQLRIMLTPYILFSATPTSPSDNADLDWTKPIYKLCATTHTNSMESELDSMTDSERLILQAIRGTSREICRVVTKMWTAGVYAGIDQLLNTKESLDIGEVTQVWSSWAEDLDQLMTWLDWSVWVKCKPVCGLEEMCYLPTWPVGFPRMSNAPRPQLRSLSLSDSDRPQPERSSSFDLQTMVIERLAGKGIYVIMPESDEWYRPQPKCVKRVDPQEL